MKITLVYMVDWIFRSIPVLILPVMVWIQARSLRHCRQHSQALASLHSHFLRGRRHPPLQMQLRRNVASAQCIPAHNPSAKWPSRQRSILSNRFTPKLPRHCWLILSNHARCHDTDTRPHKCPIANCLCGFQSKKDLIRHQNSVHDAPQLRCPQENCHYSSSRQDNLRRHQENVHKLSEASLRPMGLATKQLVNHWPAIGIILKSITTSTNTYSFIINPISFRCIKN